MTPALLRRSLPQPFSTALTPLIHEQRLHNRKRKHASTSTVSTRTLGRLYQETRERGAGFCVRETGEQRLGRQEQQRFAHVRTGLPGRICLYMLNPIFPRNFMAS